MNTQLYPTDLTDSQGVIIQGLIPPAKPGGRPRSLELRLVVNAILYVVVGGIRWWRLPREYPKWQSVYGTFRDWQRSGRWKRIHDTLRASGRRRAGRHKQPKKERASGVGKEIPGRHQRLFVLCDDTTEGQASVNSRHGFASKANSPIRAGNPRS